VTRPPKDGVSRDDLATLSAVADFVINLSIAERNHLIYGADHPMACQTREKVLKALSRALELQDPIVVHFTQEAIFCGQHCLERSHPIYRRLAAKMWRFGISGLTFESANEADIVAFLGVINAAEKGQESRAQIEERIDRANFGSVRFGLLREILAFRERDEVEVRSPEEQERLWEELMRRLALVEAAARDDPPEQRSEREPELVDIDEDFVEDYATAVIDYLKQLQRDRQQDSIMQGSALGQRLQGLLETMNPHLRHQIMASTLTSREISPDMLQNILKLVDLDHIVSSLGLVSERGDTIPVSVFRTLSMFATLDADGIERFGSGEDGPQGTKGELRKLLDGLFTDDRIETYVSADYDRVMQNLQARAEELVRLSGTRPDGIHLAFDDEDEHFVSIGAELLDRYPDDRAMAEALNREAAKAVVRELEKGRVSQVQPAIMLARRAREAAGRSGGPFEWETLDVLSSVVDRLESGDRWEAEEGVELLVSIGLPCVPAVIDLLRRSESITARKRALEVLETMEESPAAHLVVLLEADRPWFLQRNAIHILRKRADPSGLEAAKSCWVASDPRVRGEILHYLVEMADEQLGGYLEAAMKSSDPEDVLVAARIATDAEAPGLVQLVIDRELAVPLVRRGSELHLGLLRLLATKGGPDGRAYVETTARLRSPMMPWAARRFRSEIDEILGGAAE